jgi:hypothetical protein
MYQSTKPLLILRLRELGAFWSYALDANISDEVLIEEGLRWGDVEELQILFKLFAFKEIKRVWREKMLADERIYRHNFYLAAIFFNIQNPKRYILPLQKKYNRYEKLNNSAEKSN